MPTTSLPPTSGPTVLPEPPSRPVANRDAVASLEGDAAMAADGATDASSASTRRTSHPDRRGIPIDPPQDRPSAAEATANGCSYQATPNTPTGDRDLHGCWAACCR